MRYFSRSPDEWKEREKKFLNREKEKTRRSRRQGLYFLMLNLFVLFIFFVGVRLHYKQLPSQGFEMNQLFIQLDDPYVSGNQLDLKVRLYNNHNKDRTVTIKDFSIQIANDEKIVYSFSQQQPVQASLKAFTSRLLFDLKREVEISALESGEYKVIVSARVDDSLTKAEKTFRALETYRIFVDGLLDFYLPGEKAVLSVYVRNNTASVKDMNVEKVKYKLEKDNKVVKEREFVLNQTVEGIGVGKEIKVLDLDDISFFETGNFVLNIQCVVNGSISVATLPVFCVPSTETKLTHVKLYTDAPREIFMKDQVSFSVFVQNQSDKDLFLLADEISVRLEPSTQLLRIQSARLWISPYGNYEIFKFYPWNSSLFGQPGFYKIAAQITVGQEMKSLEAVIRVLE